MTGDARQRWMDFLNPDIVRTKFVTMGLFMVAHEILMDSIKSRPLDFFANTWTDRGPEQSAMYRAKVLAIDPKGKGDALRGSIAWLRSMCAITEADEAAICEITDARNLIAHQLRDIVGGGVMPDLERHFPRAVELVTKNRPLVDSKC